MPPDEEYEPIMSKIAIAIVDSRASEWMPVMGISCCGCGVWATGCNDMVSCAALVANRYCLIAVKEAKRRSERSTGQTAMMLLGTLWSRWPRNVMYLRTLYNATF